MIVMAAESSKPRTACMVWLNEPAVALAHSQRFLSAHQVPENAMQHKHLESQQWHMNPGSL